MIDAIAYALAVTLCLLGVVKLDEILSPDPSKYWKDRDFR